MWTESFLDYLRYERNYSEKTVCAYGEDLAQWAEFERKEYGEFAPEKLKSAQIREWVVALMDNRYTPASVNRKLSSLRTFYKYLLKQGVVEVDPLRKVVGPKGKKRLPTFLREGEMDRLLDDVDFGDSFDGRRDHLIIEMFYETGMRLSELVGLDDSDVDFSASRLKVLGKRNKERLIPYGEDLKREMQAYVDMRDNLLPARCDAAFFVRSDGRRMTGSQVYRLVKRNLSKVTTQKKRSPHVLRHTFATVMLNHEAGLGVVKELLGHESLGTTEVYTHVTFEELKKVYKQAHPRA